MTRWSDAGSGRVGGWVSTGAKQGLRAASAALVAVRVPKRHVSPILLATVSIVRREQESLGGQEFVRLSF